MTDRSLQEHAKQLNDVVAALIELEAMKTANRQREANGLAQAYDESHFFELMRTYELGYNENITKSGRFSE